MIKETDLIGNKFNKLTLIKVLRVENSRRIWLCRCDCGELKEVREDMLKRGKVTSCGAPQCRKKLNEYEIHDDFIVGKDKSGNEFYIDKDDYNKVKIHTWGMNPYGYFLSSIVDEKGKRRTRLLHRFILDVDDKNTVVDHINHCRHDNRKSNLKQCTQTENMQNVIKHNNDIDPYVKAIQKFVVRDHPEFGEFDTAKEASDCYQRYLIDTLIKNEKEEG